MPLIRWGQSPLSSLFKEIGFPHSPPLWGLTTGHSLTGWRQVAHTYTHQHKYSARVLQLELLKRATKTSICSFSLLQVLAYLFQLSTYCNVKFNFCFIHFQMREVKRQFKGHHYMSHNHLKVLEINQNNNPSLGANHLPVFSLVLYFVWKHELKITSALTMWPELTVVADTEPQNERYGTGGVALSPIHYKHSLMDLA